MDPDLIQMMSSVSNGMGLESNNEIKLGLFILCSGASVKTCLLIPTITPLNRYPSSPFLGNKTKAWEGAVIYLKVACYVSGRDGIQTQG